MEQHLLLHRGVVHREAMQTAVIIAERFQNCAIISSAIINAILCSFQWTTALCIKCCSIWKQVMEIYYWLRNRLYWHDAHDNRIRLIEQL